MMKEGDFVEGGSMHSFGENYDFEGKNFDPKNNYKIFGTNIDYLIRNKILLIPNYIKIDVDGIEHLILRGGKEMLKDKQLKSLSIELNENFKDQYNEVISIMKKSKFHLKNKRHASMFDNSSKFSKLYNFVFERNKS